MIKGLYVHIPFCQHICGYCDFAKCVYNYGLAEKYLQQLERELDTISQKQFETVYIGGGTPTSLSAAQLERLLKMLSRFEIKSEYTIEINPETFDEEKAGIIARYGVNRASVGVQSFNEQLLVEMNRRHHNIDVYNTFRYLRANGITNISIDLIFGFRKQTLSDVISDLNTAVGCNITHISVYDLEIWPNTPFGIRQYEKADEETCYLMYSTIVDFLNCHSYYQYEVSNFALASYQSKHNMLYWNYEDYIGVGLGACGKIETTRYENTHNFVEYLSGKWKKEETFLKFEDRIFEAVMMGLRMNRGININDFNARFHTDLLKHYARAVDRNLLKGLLILKDGYIYASAAGMMVLNDILVDFMEYV